MKEAGGARFLFSRYEKQEKILTGVNFQLPRKLPLHE